DQPPVRLDLGFARAAEEAEAAALPLKMGPATHQAAGLIVEMGQLDLKPALRGRRALPKDLEDQAGAVDHLALGFVFQRLLLDRAERGVDDEQGDVMLLGELGDFLDLTLAEQAGRANLTEAERFLANDVNADRLGEADRLVDP